jgi:hypothetical protein
MRTRLPLATYVLNFLVPVTERAYTRTILGCKMPPVLLSAIARREPLRSYTFTFPEDASSSEGEVSPTETAAEEGSN